MVYAGGTSSNSCIFPCIISFIFPASFFKHGRKDTASLILLVDTRAL